MDAELRAWRALTLRLPRARGMGILGNLARAVYARRARPRVVADVGGALMELDPAENVDGNLLFCPHLYDRREIAALVDRLRPGEVFVDVGAHIGFYALQAARRTGPEGRVVAIEADPVSHERLRRNVALNPGLGIATVCAGVSDKAETARLGLNTSGNRAGSSLLSDADDGIEVRCRPLADILADEEVRAIDAMKLDVEGMEYRILDAFLGSFPEAGWPRTVVIEFQPEWVERAGGHSVELLLAHGYREILRAGINRVLERR